MSSETQPFVSEPNGGGWQPSDDPKTTKSRKRFILTVASIISIFIVIFYVHVSSLKKIEYPPLPKVPAHVPFLGGPTWKPDSKLVVKAKHGAVASDIERCSKLGVEILQKGGFAADAAITTCLCIGTLDTMYSSGIGGGAFITTKLANQSGATSIDAREMAPGAAYRDMFKCREIASKYGGLAVATPGELKGLYTLYKLHGSGNLSWSELVSPVAKIAREPRKISDLLGGSIEVQNKAFELYKKDWLFLFNSDGTLKKSGDMMSRPALAHTLDLIAQNGSDAIFYDPNGPIAPHIVSKVREWGGILTAEDFSRYQAVVEPALEIHNFSDRNLTVYSPAGSSSGLALLSALSIINGLNKTEHTDFAAVPTHRMVEAMKWLASARTHLGDIGVYNTNDTAIREHKRRYAKFLSKQWIEHAQHLVLDDKTLPSFHDYEPAYQPNDPHGTSSLTVIDQWGNTVSITTTVNLLFGSVVHDPTTGVILNDEMDDFSVPTEKNAFDLRPSIYNYIEPYKRPLSSCAQSIIYDPSTNRTDMAIGAAGGSRIPTAILQALVRTYYYKMDLLSTLAYPRIHHQLIPEVLYIEKPIKPDMVDAMIARGHTVEAVGHMTAMNGIKVEDDAIYALSDYWRKFGHAAGY